jgi:serine/arginine repetitive matrix protein 1
MADAGFFKGTSAEQDSRFANKQKKLLKQMKFPDNIDVKIDMLKINLDVIKPWITKRLQELLGIEDDVVIEFVFNQLEDKNPDPKMMQINLTGFLSGSKARLFIGELWKFLASAQTSPDGIPAELVEMKKKELLKRQEEDDRLREIRKREEDSHRQEIKPNIEKLDSKLNGRNQMSTSRNENGNTGGYKSRAFYEDNRRRPIEKNRRERNDPEPKTRRPEKKSTRSVSKSSNSDDDHHHHRQEKPKSSSNRPPSHSRSPIKSSRKTEKHQQRSSSTSSIASNPIKKPPNRSSSNSSVDRSKKKTNNSSDKKSVTSKIKTVPVKEIVSSKSKKNKKPSKRTRSSSSSSVSRSNSNSSVVSSSTSSEIEAKKNKKSNRNRKSDHKSRKQSKSSSRRHHRSNDSKRKSHRDHPEKSKTKRSHRNESSKKKSSKSSEHEILQVTSPKKPRLESQIKVQTPPPPPPSDDHKAEPQVVPIKSNRIERIVVLEESRTDRISSISTRVSITTTQDDHPKINNSSEDENEIDLRERLLREKAIKSMRNRQSSINNTTHDRIVYETQ